MHITFGGTKSAKVRHYKLYNLACKMITPVRRTTPRKSLEVIYDILPLDLQGQLEAVSAQKRNSTILKLKWTGHNPSKKTYVGHRYYWNTILLTHSNDINETSDRIKETNPPQRYTVNTGSLTHTEKPTESQINIYTDGSLTDEHAGSGYTIQYKKKELIADSIRLPMHTTVFQAEIIAINEACCPSGSGRAC